MVPASVTLTSTLANASTVVTEFGGLVLLIAGLAIGVWLSYMRARRAWYKSYGRRRR